MSWFKRMFGKQEQPHAHSPEAAPTATIGPIGRIARAVTPLRTSGFVELDGVRYEVMSSKGYVEIDTLVRITGKRMNWFTVEPIESA